MTNLRLTGIPVVDNQHPLNELRSLSAWGEG